MSSIRAERSGRAVLRVGAGVALAGLTALLATWSFPPVGLWWMIFVAWVPMIVAQYRVLSPGWSWLAPAIGFGGFYAGYLQGVYDSSFAWWYMLLPVGIGAVVGLVTLRWRGTDEATRFRTFVIGFPLLWTAVDFLRGLIPAVATDGYPAYSLFKEYWLIQPVGVVSTHALNFLILAVNWSVGGLVLLALDRRRAPGERRVSPRAVMSASAAVAAIAVVWTTSSLLMLRDPAPAVKVAAIQTNQPENGPTDLSSQIAQTRRAAADGARIIVWPEKSLDFDPQKQDRALLTGLARRTGAYIVIGYALETPLGQRNEATVISPQGRFMGVYGKQHPAIMFSDDRTSITSGAHPVYPTPYGRVATIICYDLDFTDTARTMASHGAQLVAVPSWDPAGDATRHYGILVFRAVENRMSMVKADVGYDSAVIDPYGRITSLSVTPAGAERTVSAAVSAGTGHTPLVRLGNLPGWLFVFAAGGLVLARTVRRPARLFGRSRPGGLADPLPSPAPEGVLTGV